MYGFKSACKTNKRFYLLHFFLYKKSNITATIETNTPTATVLYVDKTY